MKTLLTTVLIAIALTGCASVDIQFHEYTGPGEYCGDGLRGTRVERMDSHTMSALKVNGVIYYIESVERCTP